MEHQINPHACFCYIYVEHRVEHEAQKVKENKYICMRNIVWNIKFINVHENTYIYMWNIVWNIKFINVVFEKNKILIPRNHIYIYEEHRVEHRFFKKPETFLILEASGLPKAETFTIFHSPMFAKCLQKSSKHVQPRNSSVEHLWNIKKCSFEGFRSPGGCCLKACSCHVGG